MSTVAIAQSQDRRQGVIDVLTTLAVNPALNKDVLIKPNFNTSDTSPGSTHNDTLLALIDELWRMGARTISLGERSFPPTRKVMREKGVLPLLQEKGVRIIDFDELPIRDWVEVQPQDSHWPEGFRVARPILETECLVSTGCLKTHQYGGVFTLSLKLHVGVVPTSRNGFNYMSLLHNSPYQQEMIAETNEPFSPSLILMDGVDVFVDGGPATGKRVAGNLMLASTDRVAVDAIGVAVLRSLGGNRALQE